MHLPVIARKFGITAGVVSLARFFRLAHAQQLGASRSDSDLRSALCSLMCARAGTVAASYFVHLGYNTILFAGFFIATGGLRHLPHQLSQPSASPIWRLHQRDDAHAIHEQCHPARRSTTSVVIEPRRHCRRSCALPIPITRMLPPQSATCAARRPSASPQRPRRVALEPASVPGDFRVEFPLICDAMARTGPPPSTSWAINRLKRRFEELAAASNLHPPSAGRRGSPDP